MANLRYLLVTIVPLSNNEVKYEISKNFEIKIITKIVYFPLFI